jgi:hypothetical protein
MSVTRKERAHEKFAWILLFASAVVIAVDGLLTLFESIMPRLMSQDLGVSWDHLVVSSPTIANFTLLSLRADGSALLVIAVFVMTVSRTGFRQGERWAWYLLWVVPIFLIAYGLWLLSTGFPPVSPLTIFGIPLSLLGLVLPFRRFFPNKGT